MEQNKEMALAYEIATALNDLKSIDWHIGIAKKLPEKLLREKLRETLTSKGIRNHAAHFNYLIKKHVNHPWY